MRSPWYFKRVNGVQYIYLGTTFDTKFLVSNPPSSSSINQLGPKKGTTYIGGGFKYFIF